LVESYLLPKPFGCSAARAAPDPNIAVVASATASDFILNISILLFSGIWLLRNQQIDDDRGDHADKPAREE
jgi:hypothetical protein